MNNLSGNEEKYLYPSDWITKYIKHANNMYWLLYGDKDMGKWCKLSNGFVAYDYHCDGCKLCEHKENTNAK